MLPSKITVQLAPEPPTCFTFKEKALTATLEIVLTIPTPVALKLSKALLSGNMRLIPFEEATEKPDLLGRASLQQMRIDIKTVAVAVGYDVATDRRVIEFYDRPKVTKAGTILVSNFHPLSFGGPLFFINLASRSGLIHLCMDWRARRSRRRLKR